MRTLRATPTPMPTFAPLLRPIPACETTEFAAAVAAAIIVSVVVAPAVLVVPDNKSGVKADFVVGGDVDEDFVVSVEVDVDEIFVVAATEVDHVVAGRSDL